MYDGVMKVYLCPQRLEQPSGQAPHPQYNQFYMFDGDLINRDTYHIFIPNDSYNMIPKTYWYQQLPLSLQQLVQI